jgi:hypothetical protein
MELQILRMIVSMIEILQSVSENWFLSRYQELIRRRLNKGTEGWKNIEDDARDRGQRLRTQCKHLRGGKLALELLHVPRLVWRAMYRRELVFLRRCMSLRKSKATRRAFGSLLHIFPTRLGAGPQRVNSWFLLDNNDNLPALSNGWWHCTKIIRNFEIDHSCLVFLRPSPIRIHDSSRC